MITTEDIKNFPQATIKRISPTDPVTMIVEKSNFNFDQLLLYTFNINPQKGDTGDRGIPGATGKGQKGDTGNPGSIVWFVNQALVDGEDIIDSRHLINDIVVDNTNSFFKVTLSNLSTLVYSFQYTIVVTTSDLIFIRQSQYWQSSPIINKWKIKTTGSQHSEDVILASIDGTTSELSRLVLGMDRYFNDAEDVTLYIANIIPQDNISAIDPSLPFFSQIALKYRDRTDLNPTTDTVYYKMYKTGSDVIHSIVNAGVGVYQKCNISSISDATQYFRGRITRFIGNSVTIDEPSIVNELKVIVDTTVTELYSALPVTFTFQSLAIDLGIGNLTLASGNLTILVGSITSTIPVIINNYLNVVGDIYIQAIGGLSANMTIYGGSFHIDTVNIEFNMTANGKAIMHTLTSGGSQILYCDAELRIQKDVYIDSMIPPISSYNNNNIEITSTKKIITTTKFLGQQTPTFTNSGVWDIWELFQEWPANIYTHTGGAVVIDGIYSYPSYSYIPSGTIITLKNLGNSSITINDRSKWNPGVGPVFATTGIAQINLYSSYYNASLPLNGGGTMPASGMIPNTSLILYCGDSVTLQYDGNTNMGHIPCWEVINVEHKGYNFAASGAGFTISSQADLKMTADIYGNVIINGKIVLTGGPSADLFKIPYNFTPYRDANLIVYDSGGSGYSSVFRIIGRFYDYGGSDEGKVRAILPTGNRTAGTYTLMGSYKMY